MESQAYIAVQISAEGRDAQAVCEGLLARSHLLRCVSSSLVSNPSEDEQLSLLFGLVSYAQIIVILPIRGDSLWEKAASAFVQVACQILLC